jgi:hypothetical protein
MSVESRDHSNDVGHRERRFHGDRRELWSSSELYSRLRAKREEIENERRRAPRRAADLNPASTGHST